MVTPEMARRWLACNPNNRKLSAAKVELFSQKILQGTWESKPPIEVFDSGRLWNGQHRLSAIVKSGKSVVMQVNVLEKVELG